MSPSEHLPVARDGLMEAVSVYQIALGKIDKMRWDSNGASDSRNFLEACMIASKAIEDALPLLAHQSKKVAPKAWETPTITDETADLQCHEGCVGKCWC